MNLIRYNGPNAEHLFSLMIDVPTPPDYMSEIQKIEFNKHLKQCEESAIDIDNPEVLTYYINKVKERQKDAAFTYLEFKPNETFLLPDSIGYEIEYQYREVRPADMKSLEWKKVAYMMLKDGIEFRRIVRLNLKSIPKKEWEKAIDPKGYATAAAKILDALKLVIGQDVNEFAMPTIIQIMKNNVREGTEEHSQQQLSEFKEKLKNTIPKNEEWFYIPDLLTLIDKL